MSDEPLRSKILWEIRSVSLGIAAVAVVAVDLVLGDGLSWAWYPLFSLAFLFVVASAFRLFAPRPAPIIGVLAPVLPLFLVGLDWAGRYTPSWSLTIGLPIALVAEAALALFIWVSLAVKRRGANLLALALVEAACVCACIEVTLDLAAGRPVALGWSAIVAFALVPVSAFMVYVHYRLGTKATLKKVFKI